MDGQMRLKVRLVSTFTKYAREDEDGFTWIKPAAKIQDLAHYLGLPMKRVRIMAVNGRQAGLETILFDLDEVLILPPAIGGG